MRTHSTFHSHTRISLAVLGALVAAALLSPATASAQSCVTNCTGTFGAGMTCMVTAYPCPGTGNTVMGQSTTVTTSYNAACVGLETMGGDLMATASHTAGQGTPATCVFSFMAVCMGGVNGNVLCTVDSAGDGLPVELMDFSIESEPADDPDGESGDRDDGDEDRA